MFLIMKKRRVRRKEEEDQTKERWREKERVGVEEREEGVTEKEEKMDGERRERGRREPWTKLRREKWAFRRDGAHPAGSLGENSCRVLSLPSPTYTAAPQSHTRPLGQA